MAVISSEAGTANQLLTNQSLITDTLITDYAVVRQRPNVDESDSHKARRACVDAWPVFVNDCLSAFVVGTEGLEQAEFCTVQWM
jgi:hypothetical protein